VSLWSISGNLVFLHTSLKLTIINIGSKLTFIFIKCRQSSHDQGRCPWTPLGATSPEPLYWFALTMLLTPTIFDPPAPLLEYNSWVTRVHPTADITLTVCASCLPLDFVTSLVGSRIKFIALNHCGHNIVQALRRNTFIAYLLFDVVVYIVYSAYLVVILTVCSSLQ
jgi:hypothetical protein